MLAQLSNFKYSRDDETEADMYGLEVLKKHGYHLDEAPKLWEKLIKMFKKAGKNANNFSFTQRHPTPKVRIDQLKDTIKNYNTNQTGFIGTNEFSSGTSNKRNDWVKDEIFMGEFEKSKYLIKSISINKKLPAEKDYFLGEYYKTKFIIEKNKLKKQKYFENSLRHLRIATELDENYPLPFLSLGSLLLENNEAEAKEYFQKFVNLSPSEPIAKLIKMEYLK
jgi:predicted Zn-dependent protease